MKLPVASRAATTGRLKPRKGAKPGVLGTGVENRLSEPPRLSRYLDQGLVTTLGDIKAYQDGIGIHRLVRHGLSPSGLEYLHFRDPSAVTGRTTSSDFPDVLRTRVLRHRHAPLRALPRAQRHRAPPHEKVRSPKTKGFVERFNGTVLDEVCRVRMRGTF